MQAEAIRDADAGSEHSGIVAELANKFHVPVSEVAETFRCECRRIERDARVLSYVAVLAARHTRTVLRSRIQSSTKRI